MSIFILFFNFAKIVRFVKVVTWIPQNWDMDFFKLLHDFLKIDTWISFRCYMDLSKLLHGFVKTVTWISLSCDHPWAILLFLVRSRSIDVLGFLYQSRSYDIFGPKNDLFYGNLFKGFFMTSFRDFFLQIGGGCLRLLNIRKCLFLTFKKRLFHRKTQKKLQK